MSQLNLSARASIEKSLFNQWEPEASEDSEGQYEAGSA